MKGVFIVGCVCCLLLLVSTSSALEDNSSTNTTNTTMNLSAEITVSEAMAIATGVVDGNVLVVNLSFSARYNTTIYTVRVERLDNGETLVAEIDANTGEILANYEEIDFSDRGEYTNPERVFLLEEGASPALDPNRVVFSDTTREKKLPFFKRIGLFFRNLWSNYKK